MGKLLLSTAMGIALIASVPVACAERTSAAAGVSVTCDISFWCAVGAAAATFVAVGIADPNSGVSGNFKAARREQGVGSQVVRATTGISLNAIEKNGLKGGKNSEVHKLGRRLGIKW